MVLNRVCLLLPLVQTVLRDTELAEVRKAWKPIVGNHDALLVRWWWQRAAKQVLDRWGKVRMSVAA